MAHYIFVKSRNPSDSELWINRLRAVCDNISPDLIRGNVKNKVAAWPNINDAYYAVQNSDSVKGVDDGVLAIGWIEPNSEDLGGCIGVNSESDGSYAVISSCDNKLSFYTDQFGSRTLWYYQDESIVVVSTSQRAIVSIKGSFNLNEQSVAWFLSSGCQGPFMSWDQDIRQVLPKYEYFFDYEYWRMSRYIKPGLDSPFPGSTQFGNFLPLFKSALSGSVRKIARNCGLEKVLLPISGGLDSRTLLGIFESEGICDKIKLVNWGVPAKTEVFDDKAAARRVAKSFGRDLLDIGLPLNSTNFDEVLNRFIEASEGRIDHFNAYTDGYLMWSRFYSQGYRFILRGDQPYPVGLYLRESDIRAMVGLEILTDYANSDNFSLERYQLLQSPYNLRRNPKESLFRWRDRTFRHCRIPLYTAAYSDLVSGFVENFSPMMSWSLYKIYMGLPDRCKGNKAHIRLMWEALDNSGVPTHATGSLKAPQEFFEGKKGEEYLVRRLKGCNVSGRVDKSLVNSIISSLNVKGASSDKKNLKSFLSRMRGWLSHWMPSLVKAYLKNYKKRNLSPVTLGYRVIMVDKIISMYENEAKIGGSPN
ncbi:hypothetical protein MD273_05185 [Marinobacter pelagius]|uniref:hypothetical protein n=1 Tax=Marinobacter sp. C7 TaxID=2951363 RepID=UPI001EEFE4AC|nr:hypothetical protein [Marinobacter sp. C7]MCG7199120.1 hypothetical protein [Marinobacter sp. C7]